MKKKPTARALLAELQKLRHMHEAVSTSKKIAVLKQLARLRFKTAAELQEFHDLLIFCRAYPDSPELLAAANELLDSFALRSDLRRFCEELASSGIAGCPIDYRFFYPMALWLAQRWGAKLQIDWPELEEPENLMSIIPVLSSFSESAQYDDYDFSPRQWLQRLKNADESDASFLVKRIAAIYRTDQEREALHDKLDLPYRLLPGPTTPSITEACYPVKRIAFANSETRRGRPDLRRLMQDRQCRVRSMGGTDARALIDLARTTMVTHERDMDVFSKASVNDVRLLDCGGGLQFALMGMQATQRYLLPALYGFLMLRNGVSIGYYQASVLFDSADLALNMFSTFRGADAAWIIARAIAVTHQLFGCRTFTLDGYQLGYNNRDGLESGVWWFYYKLGFRPRDREIKKLVKKELAVMKRRPGHRSSIATLEKFSEQNMYFELDKNTAKEDVFALCWNIAPGLSSYLTERFGADREKGLRVCAIEAAQRLGLRKLPRMSADERHAWFGWAPLVLQLKGVGRWNTANKKKLAKIMRAKGGPGESSYSKLLLEHKVLQRAILRYAAEVSL